VAVVAAEEETTPRRPILLLLLLLIVYYVCSSCGFSLSVRSFVLRHRLPGPRPPRVWRVNSSIVEEALTTITASVITTF